MFFEKKANFPKIFVFVLLIFIIVLKFGLFCTYNYK